MVKNLLKALLIVEVILTDIDLIALTCLLKEVVVVTILAINTIT